MPRDQPVWLLRFPPAGQRTALTDDMPSHRANLTGAGA
jgi:hypothetical protein